jgi:hypothetical protein
MRRIGVLIGLDENDPVYKTRLSAFTQALAGEGDQTAKPTHQERGENQWLSPAKLLHSHSARSRKLWKLKASRRVEAYSKSATAA